MNWDKVEGKWKQQRGKAMDDWGQLMNDELASIAGRYEHLVGLLQEKFGTAQEQSKLQVDEYNKIIQELKESNDKLLKLQITSEEGSAKCKKNKTIRKEEK
jgi:uncharacterized protein YjbJ (UPF0337 family)